MEKSEINVLSVFSDMFAQNAYVVYLEKPGEAFVIDPGTNADRVVEVLTTNRLKATAILVTHGHGDHIAGIPAVKKAFPESIVYVGEKDAEMLTDPVKNLSAMFDMPITVNAADKLLRDGDVFVAAGIEIKTLHLPGHSMGHVAYLLDSGGKKHLFVGDVIFMQGVGRTDFPNGNRAELMQGIRQKIFTLPDDTILYCGHGPNTTVGAEKRGNPHF